MSNTHTQSTDPLLRLPDVLALTGCSRSRIYGEVKAGNFPKPVRIGRTVAWPESEVRGWINARVRERDAAWRRPLDK